MNNNEHVNTPSVKGARYLLKHFALALFATMALSGCGGGGGGSSSSPASGANILSGTAAAGAPLVNATVTLKDNTGAIATTTTDDKGNYAFDVSAIQFPVMLEVQPNIPGAAPLYSAAVTSGTANITPLTALQTFEAAGGTAPAFIFFGGDFSKIGSSTLGYGKTTVISSVLSQMTSNGLDPGNVDPITTPMVANGTGMDSVLDHTNVAIIGNNAFLSDSTGNCIPFAALNEMTLAVDGIDQTNLPAFIGIPIWDITIPFFGIGDIAGSNLSGDFGTDAGYVLSNLIYACVAGIDQRRPYVPNDTNPKVWSNVSWRRDPKAGYTTDAVTQLISQLTIAAHADAKAEENGETPGPINIVTHSWGGVIAYIALTELAREGSQIQVANLITMGTPVECLAGDCPNALVGAATLRNAPPGFTGPIQKPADVTNWINYWGNDDIISAKINPQPGVTNKYVDCAGNLYGNIKTDPAPLPCVISAAEWTAFDVALAAAVADPTAIPGSWSVLQDIGSQIGSNHMAYFQSPTGGVSETLADIRQIVASSRTDTSATQGTAPPTSGATTLPPTAFSVSTGNPFCDTTSAATPAVNLSWSAADGDVFYRVFRNNSSIGVYLTASQLSFTDNRGLVAGQSYSYQIGASNANGTTWSNNVVHVTIPDAVCGTTNPASGSPGNTQTPLSFTSLRPTSLSTSAAPYQPTLTATGANFSNLTQIRFDWSGPTVGSKTWYKSDLDWNAKVVASSDGSSMTLAPVVVFPGDPPGLTTWTVTLTDAAGATATKTFTVNYTPPSTAPGSFLMSPNVACNTSSPVGPDVTLSWTASSGGVTYDVYRNGSLFQSGITGTSFNDTNVAAGQTYFYDIVANNPFGATQSNAVTVTIPSTICSVSIPTTPTGLSPGSTSSPGQTQASGTVTVSWSASSGAQLYIGGITDIAAGSDVVTIDTSGTSMTATLSPGKQYRWYVFACNSSGCSRSSTLYYFQTPTAPSAPTCTTLFNTSSESIDASGGQRQVILATSDPSCTWSASSNQAWVHNITPSSGTAGATLTYTVDPNSSTQSRSATIMAGQAALTVSQLGTSASCTFSLGETTQSVPADGGTFSDGLLASSQSCPRTAQSNATFITNVSPTSGNGDANISYTVAPNTLASARSGTLTIAGQTLTVDQVGSASATPTTPTTPTILSPGSTSNPGPTLGSSTVTVSWNAPNGAQLYVGGITDIAAGSDVVTINTSGTSTTATLSPGKQYRWYVYACNSSGCSSSSALYYFQTPTAPSATMTPPTLTAPADYATGQSLTPTLQWSGGSATYWQVNIRNVSTGVMVLTSAALSPSQTSYPVPSGVLQSGVQYRWNVAACPDAACLSGYLVGSPYYFTTN